MVRLSNWLRGSSVDRDLTDEMDFHLRARTEHWIAKGLTPVDAARRARVEFGGVEGYKETLRDARRPRILQELGADLRTALRQMRRSSGLTAVIVALLTLAIGANAAVFSVLDAVMLRMLPVERPYELRELSWTTRRQQGWKMSYDGSMRPYGQGELVATSFSYPAYTQLRDATTRFSDVFLFARDEINLGVNGRDRRVSVLMVSGNFFRGLGLAPARGRTIEPRDDQYGAAPVVVLTSRAWQRVFGGDPAALGSTVSVNGVPAVVVGITPPAFEGVEPGAPVDVLVPITPLLPAIEGRPLDLANVNRWAYHVMGRVKPDAVPLGDEAVRAEAEAIFRRALPGQSDYPHALLLAPGGQGLDSLRRNYSEPLMLLMVIMTAVLLIACANIAGLLLMRAASREREIVVRLALGAGRGRLVRQLITESVSLAGVAGVLGIGLALAVRGRLLPLLNQDNDPLELAIGLSPSAMAFSLVLCLVVGVLCGILPAIRLTREGQSKVRRYEGTKVATLTRGVVGTGGDPARLIAGKTLIALQVGLSLVILVGAGLFARTLVNLRSQPLGFRPDHVLLFQMDATDAGYSGTRLHDFYERMLERVSAIPGVQAASMSRYGLLSGGATRDSVDVPGAPDGQNSIGTHLHFVSPGYLETMGIALRAGRDLTTQDREGRPAVAIVNEALASRLPPGGPVVGRRLGYGKPGDELEIVGVVADARFASLRDPAPPTLYLPYRQHAQHRMTFAVRSAGDLTSLVDPIRRAGESIDPNVLVHEVRTQDEQINAAVRQERLFAFVASGFAALALLLACLGIYGTLGYSVARRTPEIGLRMALGASRPAVMALVLRESLVPVVAGIVAGLGAAMATTGVLESMLFGLTPTDRPTALFATAALVASALAAAWLPSRRASAVDPMRALRAD